MSGAGAGKQRASRALVAGELCRLWGGERNERGGVAAAEGAGREQQGAGVEGELLAGSRAGPAAGWKCRVCGGQEALKGAGLMLEGRGERPVVGVVTGLGSVG